MLDCAGEDGRPQHDHLAVAQEMLREAENCGWHHCPLGTPEGDHVDAIVSLIRRLERRVHA